MVQYRIVALVLRSQSRRVTLETLNITNSSIHGAVSRVQLPLQMALIGLSVHLSF
jgi:hypothetical protein